MEVWEQFLWEYQAQVLDNLFIGFAGDGVVTVDEERDVTIQNCEVSWGVA